MTSGLNSFLLPLTFFSVLLTMSLTWLQAAAADRAISIPVQITHAQNFDPFPSPNGKKLVFISMISGKEQLFTMDTDGSHIVQLTHDNADHEDPAWSPDGTRIAFVLITKDRHSIAVMRSDGSNVKVLTPPEQNTIHPNWSADSKRVIYCTNDDLQPPKKNAAEINAVDLATKKVTPLITGGINTYGSWSPDGSKIAFASNRRGHGYQIFIMDADGANPRLVANTEGRGTAPRWSPDGKTIYFTNCVEKDYGTDCEILATRL
jgi:TolB protein